jgi:hypothetical protein
VIQLALWERPGIYGIPLITVCHLRRQLTSRGPRCSGLRDLAAGVRALERPPPDSLWRPDTQRAEAVAVDASVAQVRPEDAAAGQVAAADLEDALFGGLRQQLESMISWAKSDEALALEHDQIESRTLTELVI